MTINKQHIFLYLVFAGVLSGCSVPGKVVKKELPQPPVGFQSANQNDTTSVAQLKFQEYFADERLVAQVEEVLAHNFSYQIADQRIKIAQAYLLSSKGALLPSVNAAILASGTRYGKYTIDGVGNFDTNLSSNIEDDQKVNTKITPNYWVGLTAKWEIDLWGKLRSMKSAAQSRFMASEEGRNLLRSALVTQTAVLYYELIALDKEKLILNENLALQQKALDIVVLQKDAGRATELAVQQFKAQLSNTAAQLVNVEQQIVAAENQLLTLRGKFDGAVVRGEDMEIEGVNYLAQHGQPKHLLEYRPDIRANFQELEATYADARAARAAFFPSLNIEAFTGFNAFTGRLLFSPASVVYQLLGNAVAPIFQQHQLKSNFNIASAQQEIAFLEYQNTVVNAFNEVKTLLSYIEKNERVLNLKTQEVDALDKGIEISNSLYVTAYASYLEIITAQKSKLEADLALIQAKRNQIHALIQLYKALGGGWQ